MLTHPAELTLKTMIETEKDLLNILMKVYSDCFDVESEKYLLVEVDKQKARIETLEKFKALMEWEF